jgi:formylmethanofuran dehydrogenase subunit E
MQKLNNSNYKIKPFSQVTDFHGHICPGSAIGYKAAEIAIKELFSKKSFDEELICITENDSCAVDAIQVVTFGKSNLIFHDYGKQAYTFINRETGDAVRLSMKESFSTDNINPNLGKLRQKVNSGTATNENEAELRETINKVSEGIINLPDNEIFDVQYMKVELPAKTRIFKSVKCSKCGEMVSDHRKRLHKENILCMPCFNKIKEN